MKKYLLLLLLLLTPFVFSFSVPKGITFQDSSYTYVLKENIANETFVKLELSDDFYINDIAFCSHILRWKFNTTRPCAISGGGLAEDLGLELNLLFNKRYYPINGILNYTLETKIDNIPTNFNSVGYEITDLYGDVVVYGELEGTEGIYGFNYDLDNYLFEGVYNLTFYADEKALIVKKIEFEVTNDHVIKNIFYNKYGEFRYFLMCCLALVVIIIIACIIAILIKNKRKY